MFRNALFALLAVGLLLPGNSAAEKYGIDRVHSGVSFKVRHFFSKVPGKFKKFDVTINFDQKNITKSTVTATIDAASVDTGNPKRDKHLRNKDFFLVEKHPKITFKSTKVHSVKKVKLDGQNVITFKVDGDFTLRGKTKKVTLNVTFLGAGQTGRGKRAGFSATTTINRHDFGVSYGRGFLGSDVSVTLEVSAVAKKAKKG